MYSYVMLDSTRVGSGVYMNVQSYVVTVVRDVQPRDAGQYTCQVNNILEPLLLSHTLDVLSKFATLYCDEFFGVQYIYDSDLKPVSLE